MAKKVKMVLYAEPGVGKSTFVSKAPNPFFITSDGNFEWLDLPEENHKQVFSWEEAKQVFAKIPEWAETVAVDLTEDLFKWCEYEYCKKNKLVHISEKGYGQGYDSTRNEFYIELSKLLGLNKHVILITHGITVSEKDRRGVEFTKYVPSQRIPDKLWAMIEGRVRYFLRAYIKAEENSDGKLIKRRYLSLIPKENEFGIARGLDELTTPEDIDLDWNTFANVVGLNETSVSTQEIKKSIETSVPTQETKVETPKVRARVQTPKVEEPKVEETKTIVQPKEEPKVVETKVEIKEEPKVVEQPKVVETPKVQETPKVETQEKELSQAEKIANIRAKLAALKQNK